VGDVRRLKDFLTGKSRRAADNAVDAIDTALEGLRDFPEQGRPGRGGLRELVIRFGRDGYVAQYRVTADEVIVLRIHHGRERR
jgi:plasmid stabilization system protein ParE